MTKPTDHVSATGRHRARAGALTLTALTLTLAAALVTSTGLAFAQGSAPQAAADKSSHHGRSSKPTQGAAAKTGGPTPAPAGAYLYIGYPNDQQTFPAGKPIKVWFGLRNMGVAPKDVKFPNTGHHHLLIDADLPPLDKEIPNDRNHLHFGAGETETTIELPPGKHTLQLLMGDEKHIPTTPAVYSKKITIYVR